MKHDVPYPLNEAQQRHIAVALMTLERHLAELRARLEQRDRALRLTTFTDPLEPAEAARLRPVLHAIEARLRSIADDLGLPPMTESVRHKFVVALEFAGIHLDECRPGHGLAGYGSVPAETAAFLEQALPALDADVQSLIHLLRSPPAETPPTP
ncbi:MAG: hypothetical protein ACK45B_11610 [Limisphaerales bacterium]